MLALRKPLLVLGAVSLVSLGVYILFAHFTYRTGFPLDDAWIHQTYARNLAISHQWAFIPGQPSAGSTAPLWSAILSLGYLVKIAPYFWTYLVGWLSLWAISWFAYRGFQLLFPSKLDWAVWVGIAFALEWHLVWAAGSGMETLLFALVIFGVLLGLAGFSSRFRWLESWKVGKLGQKVGEDWEKDKPLPWIGLGALVGLSVWLRPDGITLLGPLLFVILLANIPLRRKFVLALLALLGFVVLAGPYLLFNVAMAGSWWPNTFYAKQTEYAVLRQLPLWERYWREFSLPLVGTGALLLPGFVLALYRAVINNNWSLLAMGLWVLGYLGLYAWRLPVTYQHGRYVIPAMPVFFFIGTLGTLELLRLNDAVFWRRVLSRSWILTAGLVLVLFWVIGARAYAQDVAIIETEMVATAHWIAENTGPGDLIAAHDIGAIGFFSQRELLDLAGLVSPEVIPFIRDEGALKDYLNESGADYLVTFPDWYPNLTAYGQLVWKTSGQFGPAAGGENMAVYRLP